MVRNDATIEEWGELYRRTTFLGEMEPWRQFCDIDLIALKFSKKSEPIYCSIIGCGGISNGVVFYEGKKGLEDFAIQMEHERLGIPPEYAFFRQNSLGCFWGDRTELSAKQLKIIKELGYKYRGHNKWMYFISNKDGFYPHMADKEEVQKLKEYTSGLISALEYHKTHQVPVEFPKELFAFTWDESRDKQKGSAEAIPNCSLLMEEICLVDPVLISKLKAMRKTSASFEVDLIYFNSPVEHENYSRPINPRLGVIADCDTGIIVQSKMIEPDENAGEAVVDALIEVILSRGCPRQILTRNRYVGAYIADLCRIFGIKVVLQDNLEVIEDFAQQVGIDRF